MDRLLGGLLNAGGVNLIIVPDIHDAAALRTWLQSLLGVLAWIAGLTGIDQDDRAIAFLRGVLDDDQQWANLYDLIVAFAPAEDTDKLMAISPDDYRVAALVQPGAWDWSAILGIVHQIIVLIQSLKK
jgi:hypothetical protein